MTVRESTLVTSDGRRRIGRDTHRTEILAAISTNETLGAGANAQTDIAARINDSTIAQERDAVSPKRKLGGDVAAMIVDGIRYA